MTTDVLIVAGIITSGGIMAILPLIKDPVNRQKQTKGIVQKLTWSFGGIMFFFGLGIVLGIVKENRDTAARVAERNSDSVRFDQRFADAIQSNTVQLQEARKYIVDSVRSTDKQEMEELRSKLDSSMKANNKQSLSKGEETAILYKLKRLNLVQNSCIVINTYSFSNAQLVTQVSELLKSEKYTNINFMANMGNITPFKKVNVLPDLVNKGCIAIEIGSF